MMEAKGGYFTEAHVRVIMTGAWNPIPVGQEVDVHDSYLQRQVARMSVVRVWAAFNELGTNPVEIFCRYIPKGDQVTQVRWVADFTNDEESARAKRFYSDLVGFEGKPGTTAINAFIDNFCKEELCNTNQS